jgi:hypothetical protein
MMIAVSTIMYTASYIARDCKCMEVVYTISFDLKSNVFSVVFFCISDKNVQHRQEIQALAMKEYYEKHGGAPDHH